MLGVILLVVIVIIIIKGKKKGHVKVDDEFIQNVLSCSSLSVSYLDKLKAMCHGCRGLIDTAVSVLRADSKELSSLTDMECMILKERIFKSIGI